jgi:hypothetical protein
MSTLQLVGADQLSPLPEKFTSSRTDNKKKNCAMNNCSVICVSRTYVFG